METLTFFDHVRREWRHTPRRGPMLMALVGVGCVLFTHLVLPRFPARAIDFMRLGFRLDDMAGVLALNDLMAVYFPTFFIGLAGSLGVVLMAREEHRLELLLAKPINVGEFVAARALPVLAWTALVGVVISLACGLAVALHGDVGTSVSPAGTLGAGLALTALAIVLIALLQIPFVRIRDPFSGLLIACALWFATSIPTAVLLYRPDAYAGREALLNAVVMPSLLWHDATLAWLGPLLLVLAAPVSVLLARAAGKLLERSDAV